MPSAVVRQTTDILTLSKATTTSISCGTLANSDYIHAGDFVVGFCVFDNLTATTPTVTSAASNMPGETATFTVLNFGTAAQSAAGGCVRGAIAYGTATIDWGTSSSLYFTLSASIGATGAGGGAMYALSGVDPSGGPNVNVSNTGSSVSSGGNVPANTALFLFAFSESNSPNTSFAGTGGFGNMMRQSTTGGGAASNACFTTWFDNPSSANIYTDSATISDGGMWLLGFPDLAPTAKTGTEGPALTITESSSVVITNVITASESEAITITGAVTIGSSSTSTESEALTITESSALSGNYTPISGTEAPAVTITESRSISGTATTSESEAVTITETSAFSNTATTSESEALTISEASSVVLPVVTSESEALTITESSSVMITIYPSASDSAQIHVDESARIPTPGIGDFDTVSSATAKASGTTLTFTNTSGRTIPAGSMFVVGVASDNPASVTAPTFSTSNNNTGGTWNFLATTIGSGVTTTAGSGIWTYSFYLYSTVDVPNGTTISTITWSASVVARAGVMTAYTGVTGAPYGGGTAVSTAGTPSKATTSINSGDLVVGIGYGESASITGDADTTNGSWDAIDFAGTSGSTDATNVSVAIQDKIVTAAGIQTYNPTTTADSAVHVGAFAAAPLVIITSSDSAFLSATESTPTIVQGGSTTPVGNESPAITITESSSLNVMGTLKTAIANRETKRVNIGMLGASVTEGFPSTFVNQPTWKMDVEARNGYPTSNNPNGRGFIGHPSIPVFNNGTADWFYSGSGTYSESIGWGGQHTIWYVAPADTTSYCGVNTGPCTSIDVVVYCSPNGTTDGVAYSVDWSINGTVSNYAPVAGPQHRRINVPVTSTVIFASSGTSGAGTNVVIEGVVAYNGDESKGIQVHRFGHSSYTVDMWMTNTLGAPNWLDSIVLEDLDALIISEIGLNDGSTGGGNLTAAQFQTKFSDFIDYIRTKYFKPILVVAPPDVSYGLSLADSFQNYVTALRTVAKAKGCQFLDLSQKMPVSPNAIYYTDNVHLSTDGAGATMMADYIFSALTDTSYDSAAITITESSSVVNLTTPIAGSESEALTITDASALVNLGTTSESEAVTIAESRTLAGSSTSTESEAITISDVSSLAITTAISTSDTAAVTIADASASAITMTRTESEALTFTETSAVSGTVSASESEALTISEVSNAGANLPGTESEALSIAETSLVAVTPTASESEALTIADVSSSLILVSTTDTGAITIADVSASALTLSRAESEALTIADVSSVGIVTFVSTSESEALTFTETSAVSGTVSASESEALTFTESASAGQNNNISRPESEALTITETSSVFATVVASESEALTIAETNDSFRTIGVSESEAITIADIANVNITAGLPGTESIAVTITESRVLAGSSTSTESEALTITDASASQIQENRPESEALTITESRTLTGSSTSTESEAVTITESRSLAITTQISTSDTGAITVTDTTAALVVAQPATESEAITISETTDTIVGLTKSATDTAAITISSVTSKTVVEHNQSYVRYMSAWVPGVFKVFHGGAWVHIVPKVYRSGIWT